ncbi:zinc ribbon domain-containing protein [Solidesulfovibrio sp.]|uniref:zinc ribbon domain-containing protein n=1 Tax=Solidesulfovibrio sp. TaxID=2910990 RepID=UPI002637CF4B|nr:zinc ribbon domain-containing protein [Solidesulfovibrio sp.]
MPLYDFECRVCGRVFEAMAAMDAAEGVCACGGTAKRLVSVGRGFRADADWLESVTDVVEKDSPKPHVRAFLAEPSRANYCRWMAGEGLRPLESGEARRAPSPRDGIAREVLARFAARLGAPA